MSDWKMANEHPNGDELVEIETCGEVMKGRHVDGFWKPEGSSAAVVVSRWRRLVKEPKEKPTEPKPVAKPRRAKR